MTLCPDEESLTCLLEDRLDAAARDALERHVAGCATCLDVLAAALPPPSPAAVPAGVEATVAPASPATGRRPAARLRRGFAIAAAATLVIGGAIGYGGGRLAIDGARAALARRASERLGVPIAIGGLGAALDADLRTIAIRLIDVRLGTLDTAGGIELRLPLASLAGGAPPIERVRLERPILHLRTGPGETEPFLDGGAWLAVLAAAPAVELVDGTLVVELPGESPLRIEALSGTTTPKSDGSDATEIALAGRGAGGRVSLRGTLVGDPEPRLRLTLGGSGLDTGALPRLRDRARGRVDLRLEVGGTPSAPRFAGRALLTDGGFVDANPLAALRARAAALAPGASAASASGALDFDALHLVFAARGGRWRVPRARLEQRGLVVAAALRGDAAGNLTGHGVGQVAAASPSGANDQGAPASLESALAVPFTVTGTVDAPVVTPTR